ncbi:MAG: aromatic ring-hydroxylating dioxygenase subunit alpha [Acidimicrobiaceae bacterium]|nr:aromatic ring-hydroxylating dioxygenase subunit alpha [Acidimicrobiaceae bacterium]
MELQMQRDLARRTLELLDNKTTAMAPHVMEEPVEGYSSPSQLDLERRLIFNRYPMFVGLSSDLPDPGSWLTFDGTGTPILVTRDEQGRVRALLNMCQHRGVRVVDGGCGDGARRFTCPFHGWVYDIEGHLVGIPGAEGFDEVRREDRGLIELPAEERYGMIFAAANPECAFSLEEYLSGLAPQLESFDLGGWKSIATPHAHRIRANWKVVWGTHCETYHFAVLHKDSAGPIVYGNTSLADFYGDHALMTTTNRTIDTLRDTPEDQWRPIDDGQVNLNYRLFPNLSFSIVFGNRLEIFTIYPGENVHETVALHYAYHKNPPTAEDEKKALEEQVFFACQSVVDGEDYAVAARTEPGLHSPSAPKTLVFGRNEPVMQRMALAIRRTIGTDTGAHA